MAEHDVNYGGKKYTVTGGDSYSDAEHAAAQQSHVDTAMNIMGGGSSSGMSDSERRAAASAAYERALSRQKVLIPALVKNYNDGNWFAVAHSRADRNFYEEISGVRAIAFGKLGNYKKAFKCLLALENGILFYSGRDKKIPPIIDQNIGDKEKVTELAEEATKEALSKHLGHNVTEEEFTKFYLSVCESRIRSVPRMVNHDKAEHEMYGTEDIWKRVAKREMTIKDKRRISRGSGALAAYFFGYRNKFVSFLMGLVVGFGVVLSLDWIFAKYLPGFGFGAAFIPALFVFIFVTPFFWRHRTNFIFFPLLALSIPGWLAFFGILANDNSTLFVYISLFKGIFE
jgi:hypothetical protein